MSKKARKHRQKIRVDFEDFFDDSIDDDFDLKELSRDIYSTDWGDQYDREEERSRRRKTDFRRDLKKVYSEINDFEEFGESAEW